jgi:hypothetical protein
LKPEVDLVDQLHKLKTVEEFLPVYADDFSASTFLGQDCPKLWHAAKIVFQL